MMNRVVSIVLASVSALAAWGAEVGKSTPKGFTDDLDAALVSVKGTDRKVLAVFSGSDWCSWCKQLEAEVLTDEAFLSQATNHYALVYIDSPRDRSLLSPRAAARNLDLVDKYQIRGFPTVLVLDAAGEVLATVGYQVGGGEKYLKTLKHAVTASKYLKVHRDEVEKLVAELEAEMKKSVEGGRRPSPEEAKELVRKMAPRYLPRLQTVLESVKSTKVPKSIARDRQALAKRIEWMIRLLETVDTVDATPGAAK